MGNSLMFVKTHASLHKIYGSFFAHPKELFKFVVNANQYFSKLKEARAPSVCGLKMVIPTYLLLLSNKSMPEES